MTYEEAFKKCVRSVDFETEELEKMVLTALGKQIPKKPHKNYDKLSARWCDCGWYVGSKNDDFKYCYNCGQAIDWSDTE